MKFNPYKFYWYNKKRGMHEEAIQEVLKSIELNKPSNPWAYGVKVLSIINGNYNERDHRERHEATKESREEFKLSMEDSDMRHLVKGIGYDAEKTNRFFQKRGKSWKVRKRIVAL